MENRCRVDYVVELIKKTLMDRMVVWNSSPYAFPNAVTYIKVSEDPEIVQQAIDKLNIDGHITEFYVSGDSSRYVQVNIKNS